MNERIKVYVMNALHKIEEVSIIGAVTSEAQDIAHITADWRRAEGWRKESLLTTLSAKLDHLLGLLMQSFNGEVGYDEGIAAIQSNHPLTENRLSRLPQHLVPLIVVRGLMRIHFTPVKPDRLDNWHKFAERYRLSV